MSYRTNLTTQHDMLTHLGTTRNSGLRGNHRILTDLHIVRYLDKVVELHPLADNGRPHGCPVHHRIPPNFYILLNDYISSLRDFLVGTVSLRRKAKSITSDDHSRRNNHVDTYHTVVIHCHTRKDNGVVSNGNVVSSIYTWKYFYIISYLHITAYIRKSSYISSLTGFGRLMYIYIVLNSGTLCTQGIVNLKKLG